MTHRDKPSAARVRISETDSEPHRELAQKLGAPIYNRIIRAEVGRGETDYEKYLKTPVLLAAQSPHDVLVHHDELMFQLVHQAQELWLKLMAHESVALVRQLDADELWRAAATLARMARVMRTLEAEIEVLFTLTPASFQTIRRHLGNGSGQQSPGYNQLHVAAGYVEGALTRLVLRRGLTLLDVHQDESLAPDVLELCESLIDVDGTHQLWLMRHFVLVRRTIGVAQTVKALDGFPTKALAARMTRALFPELWDLRVQMTAGWDRSGGTKPGEREAGADGRRDEGRRCTG